MQVWDGAGAAGSADSWFETRLRHDEDWQAVWIGHDPLQEVPHDPPVDDGLTARTRRLPRPPHLRRSFVLPSRPVRARVHVTAHGVYELRLNGARVGEDELAPGWTDYCIRVQCQTYDVTDRLVAGENVVGAVVAGGWWSGFYGQNPGQHYELTPDDVLGRVLQSDASDVGSFSFSDPTVRHLQSIIEWGQRGSFPSVPTDCPQRDERLGWAADAQVFLPTASCNADVAAFFTKWMHDVRDTQSPDGWISGGTQTCYLLALAFDLLPDDLVAPAVEHLVADIEAHDHHLTTGFVGVAYLCPVLTRFGHADLDTGRWVGGLRRPRRAAPRRPAADLGRGRDDSPRGLICRVGSGRYEFTSNTDAP